MPRLDAYCILSTALPSTGVARTELLPSDLCRFLSDSPTELARFLLSLFLLSRTRRVSYVIHDA